jgi:AraC family transcriptional activator of pobA
LRPSEPPSALDDPRQQHLVARADGLRFLLAGTGKRLGYPTHKCVAFYAGELGITPTQLNRICREVLRKSALGAINARLLREAERDLVYTFIGVKEIALSLGFSDAAYFSRFFSKHKRCTPTRFREQAHRQLGREKAGGYSELTSLDRI